MFGCTFLYASYRTERRGACGASFIIELAPTTRYTQLHHHLSFKQQVQLKVLSKPILTICEA